MTTGSAEPPFTGLGVALLTVFDAAGALDERATADLARRLVEQEVRGVVVAGTTGEAGHLDADERRRLLAAVREAVGEAAVVAGTGAPTTEEAVGFTRDAVAESVDAVLALTPPGIAAADIAAYYAAIAQAAGDTPVLAYHFPAAAPPGIPLDRIADLPVAGMKDSSGDPDRLVREREILAGALYPGSGHLLNHAHAIGATGAILALANVDPHACAEALAGDPYAQEQVHVLEDEVAEGFPGSVKRRAAELFGFSSVVR